MSQKDYAGLWYEARKELGIPDHFQVGWHNAETSSTERVTDFYHSKNDGIGALAEFLRPQGYPCKLPPTEPKKPDKWRATRDYQLDEPPAFSYALFNEEQTQAIKKIAQQQKVSLAAYLLETLNRTIAKTLLDGPQEYCWFFPVNMRGAASIPKDTANGASAVELYIHTDSNSNAINTQIKHCFRSKEQWRMWKQSKFIRYFGKPVAKILLKQLSKKNYCAGSFSFVGEWPLNDKINPKTDPNKTCFIRAISTANYPLAIMPLIWDGKLKLNITMHASLSINESTVNELADHWQAALLEEIKHHV